MTTKQRSILLAVMTLVLCLALVAGGTYALFSDDVTLKNHLKAGTLDVTLERTKLSVHELNPDTGFINKDPIVDDEDVDFSDPVTDMEDPKFVNVFGITKDTLIAPGCKYTAEMRLTNNTDVAFGYWLEIVFDDKENLELADQLYVTVTTGEGDDAVTVAQGFLSTFSTTGEIGAKGSNLDVLAKNTTSTFTITVEFDSDDDVNNDAKNQSLGFDLVVHAVQVTTDPNA